MSVAPFAGVVALDNFKSPTIAVDGIQGQVPKPLAGQNGYVLTADGWVPIGTAGAVTSVDTAGTVNGITLTGGPITTSGTITLGGTLDLSSPPAIGGTTPAAGTFTTLIGGADAANYGQLTGGATTKAVQFRTLGTDTNVSMALQPKGTGAIDLAAGSSGVNISNGGTVTAVTRTSSSGTYTSTPSVAISVPTTAGGVQAAATVTSMLQTGNSPTIAGGGTSYTVGDVLTVVGGTPSSAAATMTVTTVSSGVITGVNYTNFAAYTTLPTNPFSVTGGTGTGATFNSTWYPFTFTITTAGSGYVEQPTVTFSGGGGSGAAAFATVGSGVSLRSLGGGFSFFTPNQGEAFRVYDFGGSTWVGVRGHTSATAPAIFSAGTANVGLDVVSNGTSPVTLRTGGTVTTNGVFNQITQFNVAHTASAVNYVQVTGSATGGAAPIVSVQGSDANITLGLASKGVASVQLLANGKLAFDGYVPSTGANWIRANGVAAGSSPSFNSMGTDTDIDLALTPKGTGNVRFATYTAGVIAQAGYITIKDSGGTVRRLLVG